MHDERMARTFGSRQTLIATSTVDAVLQQYPALGLQEQVSFLILHFCTLGLAL